MTHRFTRPFFGTALLLVLMSLTSCVTYDAETGEALPRGNQRYTFDVVKKRADDLKVGMSKLQALLTLGSPAESDDRGNTWVYLPERPGLLIPARALKLEFHDGHLADFGYHAIVLGAQL